MSRHTRFLEWIGGVVVLGCLGSLLALLAGCAHIRPNSFTFVQMCDPQLGFTNYLRDLKNFEQAVRQINELKPDFVVICGDLVNTPDDDSFNDFNRARRRLNMPSYCVPGNHDTGNAPTQSTLRVYRKHVGRDYFCFRNKDCSFLMLNTQLWKSPLPGETEKQDAWLENALANARRQGRPVFVVQHYPPFVNTADEPDAYFNIPSIKRHALLAAFERSHVKAILAGHTHTTAIRSHGQIEIVNSETTSQNFDHRPFGFRLWHVGPGGTCRHEFVPLRNETATVSD